LTIKEKTARLFRDIAYTEENTLSKQLKEICDFYLDQRPLDLKRRPKRGAKS